MNDDFKTLTNAISAQVNNIQPGDDPSGTGPLNSPTESRIISVILSKKDKEGKEIKFDILPWDTTISNNSPFRGMSFTESMFSGCMFGSLIVSDIRNWVDEFQFNGIEKVEIKMTIGLAKEPISFKFHIYNAQLISNEAAYAESTINERISIWKLELISSEIFLPNYNKTILENEEDFVGLISTKEDAEEPGIVNTIFKKLEFKVNTIDESRSGIWLKHDHVAYPWMKRKGQLKLSNLLKYLSNYAWDGDFSKYACDYFWWEDRSGWNFRSLTKMLSVGRTGKIKEPDDGFIITIDETNPKRILDMQVVSEYNIQNLLDSGALFSSYKRHDPNFDNPYLDFTDSADSIKLTDITYDYSESYKDIIQIDKYKLISDDISTNPFTENGKVKQSSDADDDIYGFFNENFLNSPTTPEWEVYGKTASTPWSKKAWQPQFDLTELKFSTFKDIHKLIRKPLMAKRSEYSKKKNIKRKWEVYRCTVCCHEHGALGSTADIEMFNNPGPLNGYTYNALFGPTGIFSEHDESYKITAAGSFTDLLNYDAGNTFFERGLTYSYDLTKEPYNQTIGQFFNLTGPTMPPAYSKYVLERATNLYDTVLSKIDERVSALDNFFTKVDGYKTTADSIYNSVLVAKKSDHTRPIDLTQGFRYVGDAIVGEVISNWPINQAEYGMLPHSTIPIGKGVGQVVFGSPPVAANSNLGNPITFRDLSDTTVNCVRCVSSTNGDGNIIRTPTCSVYTNGTGICPVGEIEINSCLDQEEINAAIPGCSGGGEGGGEGGGGEGGGPFENCCGMVFGCLPVPIGTCSAIGGTVVGDCLSCNPTTLPPDFILCCVDSNGPFGGSGLCQAQHISWACSDIVTSCAQCSGSGGSGIPGPRGPTGPTGPTGPSALPTEEDIKYVLPQTLNACSNDPVIRGYIKYTTEAAAAQFSPIYLYAAPYLWDDGVKDWSYFDYGSESGLIPAITNQDIVNTTRECLSSSTLDGCYNTTCLSSVALEVLRRTCVAEKQILLVERELFSQLRAKVVQEFSEKWGVAYAEWHSRNSFFFSKIPGQSIFRTEDKPTIESPLSLQNIKKITRKEVRGSRYELLANHVGVTGASAGEWIYNIFFGNDPTNTTTHPYYSQGYAENSYITSREPHAWFSFTDADSTDDPIGNDGGVFTSTGPTFRGEEYVEDAALHIGANNLIDVTNKGNFDNISAYGYAQSDLNDLPTTADFKDAFNFYNTADKKPPNIKKEEISSYVRVEFKTPIGLDRINDFPNGFVRDAGSEYFLPYLVNLSVGPFGRQSVKYNASVIGMDPYGFDVAVKKIKDDLPTNRKLQGIDKGNYYNWWNHDTGSVLSKTEYLTSDYNGMDLWPEPGFETDFPYYTYDPMQEDMHGGGYDMDFHMGGGYYFENESQDWMESLYHYGMSSGKQFDPLYRTSVVGSYILPNSYRKLKPHRSWWSLFVPRNLFIPVRFANMFKTPNTKARDLFGGQAIFTISPNYWRTWYGSEFQSWLSLNPTGVSSIMSSSSSPLSFFVDTDETTSISPMKNALNAYFNDSLMNYLAGNYISYRPGLVATDLWKYDLSGESDYGIITPPVDTEYDFFDRNFAIQFSVLSRARNLSCKDIGLNCANPSAIINGSIPALGGCTADPYCACPAQYLIPTEAEPTYLEIHRLFNDINECALIYEILGEDYLGCNFSDPSAPCSCICPEQGKEFKKYLEYDRTYATFWETPNDLPLRRQAQTKQLTAQQIKITIAPNDTIKVGALIEIIDQNDSVQETVNQYKKISGRWVVTGIVHNLIGSVSYLMEVSLVRNSLHYDPNKSQSPVGPFGKK